MKKGTAIFIGIVAGIAGAVATLFMLKKKKEIEKYSYEFDEFDDYDCDCDDDCDCGDHCDCGDDCDCDENLELDELEDEVEDNDSPLTSDF